MPDFIIKIEDPAQNSTLYFRRFTADSFDSVRKAIDDHLAKKPRAKRSDAGHARKSEGGQ